MRGRAGYLFGQEVVHFPSSEVRMRFLSDRLAHNLKVTGSNPVPATKYSKHIKDFKAEHNARLLSLQILVNTWSTFDESPL